MSAQSQRAAMTSPVGEEGMVPSLFYFLENAEEINAQNKMNVQ